MRRPRSRSGLDCRVVGLLALATAITLSKGLGQAIAADSDTGTHVQVSVIRPVEAGTKQQLACFCLTKDGRIVAVIRLRGAADQHGNLLTGAADTSATPPEGPPCEVRILDAEGKQLDSWPVDFLVQAVNVGVDGNLVLGGDGTLARFDQAGKLLARAEAPHLVAARQDPEALDRQAREAVQQQEEGVAQAVEQFEKQKEELAGKKDDELTDEERELKGQIDVMIRAYKDVQARYSGGEEDRRNRVEEMKQHLISMQRKINAIAAGESHVFITCSSSKGFGYGVWRTDLDFQNPCVTVEGLRGCCGQMDVQCCGAELVVAENARHRVVRYDADGKEVVSWGKRSRDGEGENFGGCCNPMNTRLVGDKLYVAESDGSVKLFSLDGEYLGLVGKAKVSPGCKSSIVEVLPGEDKVYYFDVEQSAICVLERSPRPTDQAAK